MPSIKVKEGQSLLDIALQECGAVEAIIDLALLNNISIVDSLSPGQNINIPDSLFNNIDVLDYYKKKQITPATAQLTPDIAALLSIDDSIDDGGTVFSREFTFEFKTEFGTII